MKEPTIDERSDIWKLDTPNRIIEKVTFGVVKMWLEQQGATVEEENISQSSDLILITSDKAIYKHDCFYGDYDPVRRDYRDVGTIKINANDGIYSEDKWTDTIFYTVERINRDTEDKESVKINILEGEKEPSIRRTKVTSELGKLIVDTLKERFSEREEQVSEQTGETTSDLEQTAEDKKPLWTVKDGVISKGKWVNLDQIDTSQIRLWNNLFDISFRVFPQWGGTHTYTLGEVGKGLTNIYKRYLFKEFAEDDARDAYKKIEEELKRGLWTDVNMIGLMDYGVVEGIATKLQLEDNENGTHLREEFINNPVIKTMIDIEWQENFYLRSIGTDEEMLEFLKKQIREEEYENITFSLMYQKYKKRVEEKTEVVRTPAEEIIKFVEEKGYTPQDVAFALILLGAKESDKTGVEQYIRNAIENPNRGTTQDPYQGS